VVLVLAAGKGKRLRSGTIKLLHDVAGRPMVAHVVEAARALRPDRLIAVIGHQGDLVREALGDLPSDYVVQRQQMGTGHAVLQAARKISEVPGATLLILNGDLPTLRAASLRRLVGRHRRSGAALSVLTAEVADPAGYGRIVRDDANAFSRIIEHRDATPAEKRIREINCGLYCADPRELLRSLRRVRPDNIQGEYYITDAVGELLARGRKVATVLHDDADEVLGVNTRQELATAARTLLDRKAEQLQDQGVTLLDAARVRIDPRARIGRDTVIHPDVEIEGASVVGKGCVIRSGSRICDSRIADGAEILDHCVIVESRVGREARIGPFSHLRPGAHLEPESRVGNFVELKKTRLGRGSKANHLAYLGDTTIGPDSNIGAGTITCNYDGKAKYPTTMGRGVFIGSDTQLVAPVKLADGAYVAAGSTVTQDVPAGALAISRSRQRNIEGWVRKREQRELAARKAKKS
jgi:bifunctional UDP-N-acetylglucosamine pyrophosphorylase/glucosamine-1-phosphate N-acetyltransferase